MDAIIVDSVTKEFGSSIVVDSLSFKVKKGSIHGFLGPNGAGKTTTMKIISGVIPSTSGNITVLDSDFEKSSNHIKSKIGVLLENPPLYMDMTVKEYLKFVCKLHKTPKDKLASYVEDAIIKLDLKTVENRIIGNLSKGYKQRVGVAQAMVFKPEIIILDEPTVGLDPKAVIEMRSLIKNLGKEYTVLLSSHLLHEISLICDEVTIISKGKLKTTGSIQDIISKIDENRKISTLVSGDPALLLSNLKNWEIIKEYKVEPVGDFHQIDIFVDQKNDQRAIISQKIIESDLKILKFVQEDFNLEDAFLKFTGEVE